MLSFTISLPFGYYLYVAAISFTVFSNAGYKSRLETICDRALLCFQPVATQDLDGSISFEDLNAPASFPVCFIKLKCVCEHFFRTFPRICTLLSCL